MKRKSRPEPELVPTASCAGNCGQHLRTMSLEAFGHANLMSRVNRRPWGTGGAVKLWQEI